MTYTVGMPALRSVARDVRAARTYVHPVTERFRAIISGGRSVGDGVLPVSAVVRTTPRPLVVHPRLRIDLMLRSIERIAVRETGERASARVAALVEPVVSRLAARAHRVDDGSPRRDAVVARSSSTSDAVSASAPAPAAAPRPVPMVLARSVQSPAPTASREPPHSSDWSKPIVQDRSAPSGRQTTDDESVALTHGHVTQITDRVIAALDRRVVASRERFRG